MRNCSVFVARPGQENPIKAHKALASSMDSGARLLGCKAQVFTFQLCDLWQANFHFEQAVKNRDLKMNLSMEQKQNQGHRE